MSRVSESDQSVSVPLHALSAPGRARLREQLRTWPLLAFDFDGTLSPIVANPNGATMTASMRQSLVRLTERFLCVVVSGRARADALVRLAGVPVSEVIGNHGSEPWISEAPLREQVRGWLPILEQGLRELAGVVIEDKGCSLSIHYRRAPDSQIARERILAVVEKLAISRLLHGKYVINLLPLGALHKGEGLARAMTTLGKTRALYVGDDDTDEDVFRLPPQAGVVGIRVGYRASSQAPLFLHDQPEVEELLAYLWRCAR